jgi:hypothetical protein
MQSVGLDRVIAALDCAARSCCQRRLKVHTSADRNCTLGGGRPEGRLALLPAWTPGGFRVGLGPAEGQIAVLPPHDERSRARARRDPPPHARHPHLPQRGELFTPRDRARRRPERSVGEAALHHPRLTHHQSQKCAKDPARGVAASSTWKRTTHFSLPDHFEP